MREPVTRIDWSDETVRQAAYDLAAFGRTPVSEELREQAKVAKMTNEEAMARLYRNAPIGFVGLMLLAETQMPGAVPAYPLNPSAWGLMQNLHPEEPAYRLDGAAIGMAVPR